MVAQRIGVHRFEWPSVLASPAIWRELRLVALYAASYAAINYATGALQFGGANITLWSPDNALSVVLLLESSLYTPVVLATSIAVDLWLAPSDMSRFSIVMSDFIVTHGYLLIAILLRDAFRFDLRKATYANMIALLAVAPSSAVFTGLLYCGVLYLTGVLPAAKLLKGLQYFWIGDAVGMIVLIPAVVAVYDLSHRQHWRALVTPSRILFAAAMFLGIALFIFASVKIPSSRYLFSLLFLPTIWIGIVFGYSVVALMLLAAQLLLVAMLHAFHVSTDVFASFQMQMFILAATGQLLGASVSEREEATRRLTRQRADLERLTAQATTGALAAAFAHEISQPLSALSGYVHAARRMLAEPERLEDAVAALQKAEAETRRTREIVTRIREFVANGRLDLATCDLAAVAREIAVLNSEDARTKNVLLTLDVPDAPIEAEADRVAIVQALNNLVVNAVESVANGDEAGGSVRLSVSVERDVARIAVEDDGPGVAGEIAEHLFEAFETTKPLGMGLGLTLASQIVGKHGGRLTWHARAPRGAAFVIELPREGAHA